LGNRDGIFVFEATNNTIGGTVAGAGNVISGNRVNGIETGVGYFDTGAHNNLVQGNYIGTDATGTGAVPNRQAGILISGRATNNTIGGTATGAGNLISGNQGDGIEITDSDTTGNLLQGNTIGTDVTGTLALGNGGNGVDVTAGAHDNTIGGTAPQAANVIAFNGNDGVRIDTGTGNAILRNSIFSNARLGIELVNHGNNDQSAPVLTSALSGGGLTTIQGTFTGRASTTYRVEFFADDTIPAQGKRFLGAVMVTTDATGHANVELTVGLELDPGLAVTATATDPANNTSPFSNAVVVTH
jgi:parallel beta-helix repeat protein